jgi:1,4-alpha-glucan branching enzyme
MIRPGELAIVLHTHMPYVEGGGRWPPRLGVSDWANKHGFGTWPFGDEWLWEVVATSYLPLLEVLDGTPGAEQLTLSLTPVLCDQLEAPGALERCLTFLRETRALTHQLDGEALSGDGEHTAAAELERAAGDYARAADTLERLDADGASGLAGALGGHATWTSAATHAVLPLLASDDGLQLQLRIGTDSHRRRFGTWEGGFWLPECAFSDWLPAALQEAGVRVACIELTGVHGRGDERHLTPLHAQEGPLLAPLDRTIIDLVWGERGYPSAAAYRAYHSLTQYHHRPWANDGQVYDRDRAAEQAQLDARDFIERVGARLAKGGLCVCALDSELLGHWWYEGPLWLAAVLEQARARGLTLTRLDAAAAERHAPAPLPAQLPPSSWGQGNDLRTWSAPKVADLATRARSVELRTFAANTATDSGTRALRELLALQSSDWAFMAYFGWAGAYPRERADQHAAELECALAGELRMPFLRNLAPWL